MNLSKFSEKVVLWMIEAGAVIDEDKEIYEYGVKQSLILLINVAAALGLGLIMGRVFESFLLLLAYIPLRTYAGGYHSSNPIRCFLYSLAILYAELLLIKYLALPVGIIVFLALVASGIIVYLAPVEAPNKPVTDKERKKYSKTTRKILIIEALTLFIAVLFNAEVIALCITVSIAMVMLLMLINPVMLRLQSLIGKVDKVGF